MLARWYNTDTGQFDTRDTATNSAVPASINANRYQYGDGNPLTTIDPTGHWGFSLKSAWNTVKSVAAPVVNAVTSTYNYVASGQAWQDVKKATSWVVDKAVQATKTVVNSSTKWVKQKYNTVKDKVNDAKKCLSGGVTKCVKDTAKAAAKAVGDTVKNTVKAIREDPWKFLATAAVGIAATIAVGALCATGVGCLLVAGAVAGALSSGAGYMIDVGRGDAEFSWSGLADTMIQGGLDGALTAGIDKFTGGASKYMTKGPGGAPKLAGGAGGSKASVPSPARGPTSGKQPGSAASPGGGRDTYKSSRGGSGGGASAASGKRGPIAQRSSDGRGSCDRTAGETRHSFDPATLVLLADGTTKQIGHVAVGDKVLASDPMTGMTSVEVVQHLHRNVDTSPRRDGSTRRTSSLGIKCVLRATPPLPSCRLRTISAKSRCVTLRSATSIRTMCWLARCRCWSTIQCPSSIALGLTSTDENRDALLDFGLDVGATPWMDWDDPGSPWKTINEALKPESEVQIHFNLDGIRDPVEWAKNPDGALTAEELAAIRDAPESVQKRVTWWKDGEQTKSPFAKKKPERRRR